jgi:hypothetical protein
MIMMMTDPDRVALSAFLPAFLFRSNHPFMSTSTPTFHRNVPPAICHTSYYPPRLRFHIAANLFVFFPLLVNILAYMPAPPLLLTPSPFSLCAAPLSRSSFISTSFAPKQPTTTDIEKKLANIVTSRPPPLILCKPARVHAPTFDYLCIYYPWRYLSRTKKKDLLGKRDRSTKKRRS